MFTPANSSATATDTNTVTDTAPVRRRRLIAAIATLAMAVAVLAAPQLSNSAAATASPSVAAHKTSKAPTASALEHSMLTLLNTERKAHGLAVLHMNTKLTLSAHRHNLAMAKADEMSHQVKGEKFFADRITAAHYNWMSAGENIGWNSNQTLSGLRYLEREMYREKAPDNGHRLNILDHSFQDIGIDVYFDKAHDKMWFTQDFGQPA